jgi:hypothetical protein
VLSFIPALPLCITHGAISHDIVPALGLIPLFFSAGVSLFLLLAGRRRGGEQVDGKGKGRETSGGVGRDLEGLIASRVQGRGENEAEGDGVEEGGPSGIEADDDDDDGDGRDGESVLTHRISVFVIDVVLAAGLMVVLVFTWIRTGRAGNRRPELAMLAAYSTVPLLVNL